MSHVVCSNIIITDLDLLRKALLAFPELKWNENRKTFNWYGSWMDDYKANDAAYRNGIDVDQYGTCDVCIQMEGVNYEMGVVRRKDGQGWSLVWDNVSDGYKLDELLGSHAEKLVIEYSQAYIRDFAERNGFIMDETVDGEGNLVLTMTAH